ncbi:hypothetical protein J6590_052376 [Homalodisca vitripennis]|nr:hypothetical protein J6590_052376 [Homalodisca vitripennis]
MELFRTKRAISRYPHIYLLATALPFSFTLYPLSVVCTVLQVTATGIHSLLSSRLLSAVFLLDITVKSPFACSTLVTFITQLAVPTFTLTFPTSFIVVIVTSINTSSIAS